MTKAIPYEPKLFEASDETDLDYMQVNISGLPGSSKTFTALTISDQWGGWPAKSLTYLEDIIHIGHDRTPLIGLLQHNYRVRYKIDIQKIMGQKGWTVEDAINAALDESYEICDKVGGIKAYIDDTVSSLDFALQGHFFSTIETDNTVLLYGKIGAAHQQYKSAVNGLGVMPIALFHLRTLAPDIAKKTEDKKRTEAAKMLIQGDQGAMLIPEISGKAARYYFGAGSVELVCRSYRSPQSGDWQYVVYPNGWENTRAKNRLREFLEDKEPANLQKLLTKIRRKSREMSGDKGDKSKDSPRKSNPGSTGATTKQRSKRIGRISK